MFKSCFFNNPRKSVGKQRAINNQRKTLKKHNKSILIKSPKSINSVNETVQVTLSKGNWNPVIRSDNKFNYISLLEDTLIPAFGNKLFKLCLDNTFSIKNEIALIEHYKLIENILELLPEYKQALLGKIYAVIQEKDRRNFNDAAILNCLANILFCCPLGFDKNFANQLFPKINYLASKQNWENKSVNSSEDFYYSILILALQIFARYIDIVAFLKDQQLYFGQFLQPRHIQDILDETDDVQDRSLAALCERLACIFEHFKNMMI